MGRKVDREKNQLSLFYQVKIEYKLCYNTVLLRMPLAIKITSSHLWHALCCLIVTARLPLGPAGMSSRSRVQNSKRYLQP